MADEKIQFTAQIRTVKGTLLNSSSANVVVVDTSRTENKLVFTYGASSTVSEVPITFNRTPISKTIDGVLITPEDPNWNNPYPGNGTHKVEVEFEPAATVLNFTIGDDNTNTVLYSIDTFPESLNGIQINSKSNFKVPSKLPSRYISLNSMFYRCTNFNQPLNTWDVSKVTDMSFMFNSCTNFDQSLNSWDVSKVTGMRLMFYGCTKFNQNINSWNTGNVTTMHAMFYECTSFNQPLNNWTVGNVTTMHAMFQNCTLFNQPLNSWDTGKVANMTNMFNGCTMFNQPLNTWNTNKVTNMADMFSGCTNFNQPLNNWNTNKVTNMANMFKSCTKFNQDLSQWCVPLITLRPASFNYNAPYLTDDKLPVWGTCPSR